MQKIKVVQIGVGHDHAYGVVQALLHRTDIFDFIGYVVVDGEESIYEQLKHYYVNAKRITLEQAFATEGL